MSGEINWSNKAEVIEVLGRTPVQGLTNIWTEIPDVTKGDPAFLWEAIATNKNVSTILTAEEKKAAGFDSNGIYSDSKCQAYEESKKLKCPSAFIIPSIIAGSGRKGFFSLIAAMISRYRIVIMPGECTHATGMVHVDDVCSLVIKILASRTEGIFNADSGEQASISEWVDIISHKLNKKIIKIKIPLIIFKLIGFLTFYRFIAKEQLIILGYPQFLNLQESKAIGWQPTKSIEEILEETL